VQISESPINIVVRFDRTMGIKLERDSNGRMIVGKGKDHSSRTRMKKALALGMTFALVAIAVSGISAVIAAGDNNMYNHQLSYGEDGYYEENNCNPYDDDDFPGDDTQNRTGVDEIL
jgi:hypothetical protein